MERSAGGGVVPATRGRPRSAAADERILKAAFRQLVERGYGGVSMESVAAEAGVAKTTIYRRYPAKRDLVVATLRAAVPFEGPAPDMPVRDAIDLLIRLVITGLVESGAIRVLGSLLAEERREPALLEAFREEVIAPRRALVVALLQRGIARGEVRADVDPLVAVETVAGATIAHHLVLGLASDEAWIASLVDHTWTAIRARTEP